MSRCLQAYGVNIMQIREYLFQTALVALVHCKFHLFSTLVIEQGWLVVQTRSMRLTWQRRSRSSRLLPLATANRNKTPRQKRRNRTSAAVSHQGLAPLISCSCVASQCPCWLRLCSPYLLCSLVRQQPGHLLGCQLISHT